MNTFCCPLCRESVIFMSRLCLECEKIRYVMSCYSREKVIEVVEKIFLIEQLKKDKKGIEEDENADKTGYKKIGGVWVKNDTETNI